MKSYCYECGVKLDYPVNEKPKFCHNCGTPFGDKEQSPKQPPQHTGPDVVAVAAEEAIDSPANDAKSVPVINGLDFEIHHIKPNTFKLGEVMEQQVAEIEASDRPIQPMNIPPQKGDIKKGNRKKFLQNWEKEGGTLRSKKPKNNV